MTKCVIETEASQYDIYSLKLCDKLSEILWDYFSFDGEKSN